MDEMNQEKQSEEIKEATQESLAKKEENSYENFLILYDLVRLFSITAVVFIFLFRLVAVDGISMYPTLVDKDCLVLESNFLYRNVKQGDIVVLNTPYFMDETKKGLIVKRVIATGGQTVDIDFTQGIVYVDGEQLNEDYINELTYESYFEYGQGLEYPVTVPEGSIFVMGDNRNESLDSRYAPVGCVKESCILGKVLLVAVPGRQTDMYGNRTGGRTWARIGTVS